MKSLPIIAIGIFLLSVFFIPNAYIEKIIPDHKIISESVGDVLTIITFFAGFILVILPMKVDSCNQKPTVQARLHTYLIKRNRFLTVLFFLFIIKILLLTTLLFYMQFLVLKLACIIFVILLIAIIRLFFIIREYVEYRE